MKMYPVQFEITDEADEHFAKFDAFDDESLEVDIKKQILDPSDLRKIADKLEDATEMLKHGVDMSNVAKKCETCTFHDSRDGYCRLLNVFGMSYCSKWAKE